MVKARNKEIHFLGSVLALLMKHECKMKSDIYLPQRRNTLILLLLLLLLMQNALYTHNTVLASRHLKG